MGNIFSGSEVVELSVRIEKNGRDFYSTLAMQTKIPKAKEMFSFLSKEEERHILVFQEMLDRLEKYEPPESYPGEYFAYMSALAQENVFTQENKGAEIAKKIKNDKEALGIGITAEKDSIIFYEGMKKAAPESEREIIDEVIAQEQGHLKKLLELEANI